VDGYVESVSGNIPKGYHEDDFSMTGSVAPKWLSS
jgi:hypothetical protein